MAEIAKKIKIKGSDGDTYGWIMIDDDKVAFKWDSKSKAPSMVQGIYALMQDKDVYHMMRRYCQEGFRKNDWVILEFEGMSGCRDYSIQILKYFGGAYRTVQRTHLLHVSCAEKLNEGVPYIWIGDFVELCNFIGVQLALPRKYFRRDSRVKYLYEHAYEIDDINHGGKVQNYFGGEKQ